MRLCGQEVEIEYFDPVDWEPHIMGRMVPADSKIMLRKGLPLDAEQSTFLHEIIHFIVATQALSGMDMDNETTVSVLANSLLAWMKDNPEIAKRFIGKGK